MKFHATIMILLQQSVTWKKLNGRNCNKRESTTLKHIQETAHSFNCKNTKVLHKDNDYINLKIYKNNYVQRNPNTVNLKTETNNMNNVDNNLIHEVKINIAYKKITPTINKI